MHTAHFKEKLLAEKERLEKEMHTVGRPNPTQPGEWEPLHDDADAQGDIVDQADAAMNREQNAAILKDLGTRRDAVIAALGRIEAGTYGICEVDSGPIEEERLEADPAATTCKEHL